MQQLQYHIFDLDDDTDPVTLQITSNRNIKKVCRVLCNTANVAFPERAYYAEKANIMPFVRDDEGEIQTDENGDPIVEFTNEIQDFETYWARLAEALFVDCPQITKYNEKRECYEIKDKNLSDGLIRGAVKEALEDFLAQFGLKPYGQDVLSDLFQIDLNSLPEIQQLDQMIRQNLESGASDSKATRTKSNSGETKSPKNMETGS